MLRICVIGDYEPGNETHTATTSALQHAAVASGRDVEVDWVPTVDITSVDAPRLQDADGLLIAPGSPYRHMDGALAAVTYARTRDTPLLGTCGGFQHLVVEFARNVLGVHDAEHAESKPDATTHVITPLTCSLFGQRMDVEVRRGTKAFSAYGRTQTTERYYCNFGLNPAYATQLERGGLVVSAVDRDGEVRILEHPRLRFFMGTLFVPQMSSTPDAPHPLVAALVEAAASRLSASNEAIAQSVGF
ncbi:MAG TPA: gamma-glutamyl-gamma-aminobutyrate hydrolase family protein [Candidatus Acidoferrales bacterium]|nr:gamma-glutamyl-gamma-aminobutyrate hydrolase family protein [Candidatus Acidoferrales bacterium]